MAIYGMGWVLHPIVTLAPLKPRVNARIGLLGSGLLPESG